MEAVWKQRGKPIHLAGNRPLSLAGKRDVYLVTKGTVDVFSVPVRGGELSGPRQHLLRLGEGELFTGFGAAHGQIECVAVGKPGTRVMCLDRDRWLAAVMDSGRLREAAFLLDTWGERLGDGVRQGLRPKRVVFLAPGDGVEIGAGEHYTSDPMGLWVFHRTGSSRFMGREDLPPVVSPQAVPVFRSIWLTGVESGLVDTVDTARLLESGSLWPHLDRFHELLLDIVVLNRQRADREEWNRLKKQFTHSRQKFSHSLTRLVAILAPTRKRPVLAESSDPLLAACQIVGAEMKVRFSAPREETGKGHLVDRLTAIARVSGVRCRLVILREGWWKKENGPLLAFRKEDEQPVALVQRGRRRYVMIDPVSGEHTAVTGDNEALLKPEAHQFYRPLPHRALSTRDFISFGLNHSWRDALMVFLMGLVAALLGLITPVLTGIVFNSVIPSAAVSQLVQIIVILLACAVAAAMFEITKSLAMLRIESRADITLQAAIWDRLISLPPPFFRQFSAGDLANRSLGINAIRRILSGVTVTSILASIFSVLNFALLFYYDWQLALVASVLALVSVTVIGCVSFFKVHYQRQVNELEGRISGMVLQFITGINKLRVSGTEERAFSVWAEKFAKQKRLAFKAGTTDSILMTFNSALPLLASMSIFAWIVFKSVHGISTGDFIAFTSAYTAFQNALIQMSIAMAMSLNVIPFYERLQPILKTLPETDESKGHPGELSGQIEVNHLVFRYLKGGPVVLNDVSLQAEPGEFIALVGSSGSGKSTLLRLLLGFEVPESGTIYYDGQDLGSLDVRAVRQQIGVVIQNGRLLGGDIFRNIVGATNLTQDDAWEAARMAGLEEDIRRMPMGLHTVISSDGSTISGGQRQRILIARAIVRKPRILFFDEATSALDNQTQAVVSRSLEALKATRIVIAHRLSTILHADRIYVLEQGKIVESGTYQELTERDGVFARLARRQLE